MPKYIFLAVVLVVVSATLPAYSQTFMIRMGIAPTLTNLVNILVQVALSYPAMEFWIMPRIG